MFTLTYKQKINISHFLALEYDSKDSNAHGHVLTITIECFSTRLNANNMVVDTNLFRDFLDTMSNESVNEFMKANSFRGNPTLENIALIVKTYILTILKNENFKYSTETQLMRIKVEDENERQVVYNYQ